MLKILYFYGTAIVLPVVTCWPTLIAIAQIIPDNTLPINSTVKIEGDSSIIEAGTTAGSNLFHSFQEFSIPTGGTAYFNNNSDIQNIFSRVTGSSISNIDGTMKANGTANLFLLNPNGIVFGPNASLNIGGSFIASTANSFKFADGSEFSAITPQTPPLLSINVPVGLQLGANPGAIAVQGSGNKIRINEENVYREVTDLYLLDDRPNGLRVNPNQTIALVGGEILLDGGNLTAANGRIELGSVAQRGEVTLTPSPSGWHLGYQGIQNFADIRFANSASASTTGEGGGSIQIQSRQLSLENGSVILGATLGAETGGNIDIRTTDSVILSGANPQKLYSLIVTEAYPNSTGGVGDINIETGSLRLLNGALIFSSTFGRGNGGSITVRASELMEISGVDPDGFGGYFGTGTPPISPQKAGNISIETQKLILSEGALITSGTSGEGNGGSLIVHATDSVQLTGIDLTGALTTIQTEARPGSSGNAGNLTLETKHLSVRDGATITAGTAGTGAAGTLTVKATDSIEVVGIAVDGSTSSSIATSVAREGTGTGGNLTIETRQLSVLDGGLISAGSLGASGAGTLTVKAADSVLVSGESPAGKFRSSLTTSVDATSTGAGGNLTIQTGRLTVRDGGSIATITAGSSSAGNLSIEATDTVELLGDASVRDILGTVANFTLSPSDLRNGLFTIGFGAGKAGEMTIDTGKFIARNGASAFVSNFGDGQGGEMTLRASESVEITDSALLATNSPTTSGIPGNITINTRNLTLQQQGIISASTAGSRRGGNVTINATESIEAIGGNPFFNSGQPTDTNISTATLGSGDAGNLNINTGTLIVRDGAAVSASTLGAGRGGALTVTATDSVIVDGTALGKFPSSLGTNSQATGDAGTLRIITGTMTISNGAIVSASNNRSGRAGNVEITARRSLRLDNKGVLSAQIAAGDRGNIILQTQDLQLRRNSRITTNATRSATGGNIAIDADTITALENSTITANAIQGQGGNIQIDTRGVFLDSNSTISAASEFGISGVVEIKTPDTNVQNALVLLETTFAIPDTTLASNCRVNPNSSVGNSFTATGTGGLPSTPYQALSSRYAIAGVLGTGNAGGGKTPIQQPNSSTQPRSSFSTQPPTIVEAQGISVTTDGRTMLVAQPLMRQISDASNLICASQ